jgi:hypothetical protein
VKSGRCEEPEGAGECAGARTHSFIPQQTGKQEMLYIQNCTRAGALVASVLRSDSDVGGGGGSRFRFPIVHGCERWSSAWHVVPFPTVTQKGQTIMKRRPDDARSVVVKRWSTV